MRSKSTPLFGGQRRPSPYMSDHTSSSSPFHYHRRGSVTSYSAVQISPRGDNLTTPRRGFSSMTVTVLRRLAAVAFLLAAVSFSCIVLYRAAVSAGFGLTLPTTSFDYGSSSFSRASNVFPFFLHGLDNVEIVDSEEHRLERVLKDAAMEDKTVILTTLNEAWSAPNSVIDLFLESFRTGDRIHPLLNHLVIIALDEKAFSRCLIVHTHCFALTTEGVDFSKEAYFMTPDYLKMMWRRIDFLRSILEMGYNFLFTDADVMWFRDPFPHFYLDADFQIACDHFSGQSDDLENQPNGGFKFVRSNNRSIEFYKFWYTSRETYPGLHDQDVLNRIKNDLFVKEIGLKIRFLDTTYFGGFCEPSKDPTQVCTMHANCCFGLDSKMHDLRLLLQDWQLFMSLPPSLKKAVVQLWRVPQNCSLDSLRHFDDSQRKEEEPPKNVEQLDNDRESI